MNIWQSAKELEDAWRVKHNHVPFARVHKTEGFGVYRQAVFPHVHVAANNTSPPPAALFGRTVWFRKECAFFCWCIGALVRIGILQVGFVTKTRSKSYPPDFQVSGWSLPELCAVPWGIWRTGISSGLQWLAVGGRLEFVVGFASKILQLEGYFSKEKFLSLPSPKMEEFLASINRTKFGVLVVWYRLGCTFRMVRSPSPVEARRSWNLTQGFIACESFLYLLFAGETSCAHLRALSFRF